MRSDVSSGPHIILNCAASEASQAFLHPSSEKLYKLLKKACPEDTTPETQKRFENISSSCDPVKGYNLDRIDLRSLLGQSK